MLDQWASEIVQKTKIKLCIFYNYWVNFSKSRQNLYSIRLFYGTKVQLAFLELTKIFTAYDRSLLAA